MSSFRSVNMTLLEASKETDNKFRWDAPIGDASFKLYIPKWRVPSRWPTTIRVRISPISDDSDVVTSRITPDQCANEPMLANTAIDAIVRKTSEHTETVRYDPIGDEDYWEIGSPYIPYSLTHDEANMLRLCVEWNALTE